MKRTIAGWLAGLALGFGAGSGFGAETGTIVAEPVEIRLEWQALPEPVDVFTLRLFPFNEKFAKEPDLAKHRVARGGLALNDRTNQATAFAWDQTANQLYLDLNGNRDLTDDPGMPLAGEYEAYAQLFPRTRIGLWNPLGRREYSLDLRLNGSPGSNLQATGGLRSIWQGRLDLGGHVFQVGLVENPAATTAGSEPRYLLFRPWEEREEPLRLNPGTPALVDWKTKVVLAGQAFSVSARCEPRGEAEGFILSLRPERPPLGLVRVTGSDLYRVILTDGAGYTCVIDHPEAESVVPVGNYRAGEIWVRNGGAEAFYKGALNVLARTDLPGSLEAGGPLTNEVALAESGDYLVLSYRLRGRSGLEYRLAGKGQLPPPEWKIFSGGRELDAGKFAYG